MTATGFWARSGTVSFATRYDLQLRLGDCGPFLVLDDRELQRSLTVEIEVADVQRDRRLHPLVDRAKEETGELLHPGAELVAGVAGEHDDQRFFDLLRQQLLGGEEVEARIEHREG